MDTIKASTEVWYSIRPFLPIPKKVPGGPGRPHCDLYEVFQRIVWVLSTGSRWRNLPKEGPSYKTCSRRFQEWCRVGVFREALSKIARQAARSGKADLSETYVDGSFILAKSGGALVGKSFKGRGSKILVLLDRKNVVHSVEMAAANQHDITLLEPCLEHRFTLKAPKRIIGDKAFDSDPMDKKLLQKGIELIAPDRNCKLRHTQDRRKLRRISRRWTIERFFARIKGYRRVAIRWDRKPESYLAMVHLACLFTHFTGF